MIVARPPRPRGSQDEKDRRHAEAQRRYNARLRGEPTEGVKCCLCPEFFDVVEDGIRHLREMHRTL